jgi:chromosome segregation ATPase
VLNEQERCRTLQSAHEQQLKAARLDLEEVQRHAAEDMASASAAAATKEAALRSEIALLKSDIVSMQIQEESGLKSIASSQQLALDLGKEMEQLMSQLSAAAKESNAKDIALEKSQDDSRLLRSELSALQLELESASRLLQAKDVDVQSAQQSQQLVLDLGKEVEQLMSQLSASAKESNAKDIALEKSQDDSRLLRSELSALQLELESASRLLQAKDVDVQSAQQSVFDLETEISGLKNDFNMFGKMLRGQSLSEEQLVQIRPLDESNARHMEIYQMICLLNELVVASSRPLLSELQCIAQAEALAAKLKETESSLTIELEKSWNMAKKMSDMEDERSGFIVAIRDAAAALSSKDDECSVLVSQVEDLKKLRLTSPATSDVSSGELSRNEAMLNAERIQDIQRKNLEIAELKIQLSALKIEFDRLSAASSKSDVRAGSDLLDSALSRHNSSRNPRNHYELQDHSDAIRESSAAPSRDSSESLLSQYADTPRPRDVEEDGHEWQLKLDKLRSQNDALTAHVKSLYAEIKNLRLQQCSDAVLVQKLAHMESLNVEIMKRSAESEIMKDSTEHKLEVAQMVIKHLKQCTLELDEELKSLKSNSSSGQAFHVAGHHIGVAVKKESETSHGSAGDIEKQLIASQSEVRALSRMLSESIATNETKEFDLRLRISQLEDVCADLQNRSEDSEKAATGGTPRTKSIARGAKGRGVASPTIVEALSAQAVAAEMDAAAAQQLAAAESLRVAQLENSLKDAEAASARLNGDVARLEEQLSLANSELNAARKQCTDEKASAAAEIARINSELQSSSERVEDASAQAVAAKKDAAAAQQLAAAESLRVAQLENSLKDAEAASTRLNGDIARLEEQLSLANSELNAARKQCADEKASAAAEIARINSELESHRIQSASEISDLQNQLKVSAKVTGTLQFQVQELQSQIESVSKHRAAAIDKATEAAAYAGQFKARIAELETQLSSAHQLQVAAAEQSAQLEGRAEEITRIQQVVQELNSRVAELDAELNAAKARGVVFENEAAVAQVSLNERLSLALAALDQSKSIEEDLKQKLSLKDEKIIKLSTKLGARVAAAENDAAESKAEAAAEAARQLIVSTSSLEFEKSRNELLQVACDRLKRDLDAALSAAIAVGEEAPPQQNGIEVVVKQLLASLGALREENSALSIELLDAKRRSSNSDARISDLQSKVTTAAANLEASEQLAAANARQADALATALSELETTASGLRHDLVVSSRETDASKQTALALQDRVSDLEAAVVSLQYDAELQMERAVCAEKAASQCRSRVAAEIAAGIEFERDRNELLRVACDRLKEELAAARAAAMRAVEERAGPSHGLEVAVLNMQLRLDKSGNELTESKRRITQLEAQVADAEAAAASLQRDVADIKAKAQVDAARCADDFQASKRQMDEINTGLSGRLESCENLLKAARQENEEMKLVVISLEEKNALCTKSAAVYEQDAKDAAAAVAAEVSKADALSKSNSVLHQAKIAAEAEVAAISSLLAASAARVDELEKCRSELQSNIDILKVSLADLSCEQPLPSAFQSEIMTLRSKIIANDAELQSLRQQVTDETARSASEAARAAAALETCRSELKASILALEEQLASAERCASEHRLQIQHMKRSIASEMDDSLAFERSRSASLEAALQRIQQQLVAAQTAAMLLCPKDDEEASVDLSSRVQLLERERSDLEAAVEPLRLQLADQMDKCSVAMAELDHMSQSAAERDATILSMASKLASANADLSAARAAAEAESSRAAQNEQFRRKLEVELETSNQLLAKAVEAKGLLGQRIAEQEEYAATVQARAVAAENEASDLKARGSVRYADLEKSRDDAEKSASSLKAQLAASTVEISTLSQQILELKLLIARGDAELVASEARAVAAENEAAGVIAAADNLRAALVSAEANHEQVIARHQEELRRVNERVAAAGLSISFIRSSSQGKDATIKMLRFECEQLNAKLGPALANEAAFAGLKVALHEANTQRASLLKSISDSQKKITDLTGSNDLLSVSVAQLEKERDALLDEIQEYRQVLAAADSKINEYEVLHAQTMMTRLNDSTGTSPGPQAWNLSEPSRGVSQEDTYVLQSTPERQPQPTSKQGQSDGRQPLPEDDVDEYSDMLQVLHL